MTCPITIISVARPRRIYTHDYGYSRRARFEAVICLSRFTNRRTLHKAPLSFCMYVDQPERCYNRTQNNIILKEHHVHYMSSEFA